MAWPTDRLPDDALTGEFVPQVWSAKVLDHVRSYLVSAQVVNTEYKADLTMGDLVYIPVMTTLTATTVDVTTNAVYTNMNTTAGTTVESITVDHWQEAPVQIDDSVKKQTHVGNLLSKMADNAAFALEKAIDAQVHVLFSGLSSSSVYGADGQTFSDDILIALMEGLDEADVPRENRSLIGDPSTLADIYKIDKFMSYDYSRDPMGGQGAFKGTIIAYNLPVYTTNHLTTYSTGNYGCLLHRDAIGLVLQMGPDVETWRAPDRHSDIINISTMWGEDELRDTFGKAFYTRKT